MKLCWERSTKIRSRPNRMKTMMAEQMGLMNHDATMEEIPADAFTASECAGSYFPLSSQALLGGPKTSFI